MKNYILVLILLVVCCSCKSKKDIGILKNTEVFSLAGTSWEEKRTLNVLFKGEKINLKFKVDFIDKNKATVSYYNPTKSPNIVNVTYNQDGLTGTIHTPGVGPVFNIKIKSDNVLELVAVDDKDDIARLIRIKSPQ